MTVGELIFAGLTFGFSVTLGIFLAAAALSLLAHPPESVREAFVRVRSAWETLADAFGAFGSFVIGRLLR